MHHGRLSVCLLIVLASSSAIAQVSESDSTRHAAVPGSSGMTSAPTSSWEGWINHGMRDATVRSQVSPGTSDIGRATAPRSPAIDPGSGSVGQEAGSSPSRLRSNEEASFENGATAEKTRR